MLLLVLITFQGRSALCNAVVVVYGHGQIRAVLLVLRLRLLF